MSYYSDSYSLNDIEFCLKNMNVLQQRAEETGNMTNTVDLIVDANTCLSEANLTPTQAQVIQLRWLNHMTLKECGNCFNVSLEAVRQSEELARIKIQHVLDQWEKQSSRKAGNNR